jgi:hypothetical protein
LNSTRFWFGVVGVGGLIAGAHDLITGRGSLVFGTHLTYVRGLPKTHFTGPAAAIEGVLFLCVGVYCLYRAVRGDDS